MQLPGKPSDEIDDVLATGRGDITTLFVSMATRHPGGADAEYLRWHTLDHRPEQHRLSAVRVSVRLVGQSLTYCFLDDDPLSTAERLAPVLTTRWGHGPAEPLLAAPFYPVVPHEWDRYVP
jgi:hypothetical protein